MIKPTFKCDKLFKASQFSHMICPRSFAAQYLQFIYGSPRIVTCSLIRAIRSDLVIHTLANSYHSREENKRKAKDIKIHTPTRQKICITNHIFMKNVLLNLLFVINQKYSQTASIQSFN